MKLDAPIAYSRFDTKVLSMLVASAAARATAERNAGIAIAGLLFWGLVWLACSVLRARLRRQEDSSHAVRLVANTVAGLGLLLFVLSLLEGSLLPALLVLLACAEAALILLAEKRSHLWLMVGGALAMVFFAAAESRSALFVVCLVWFTLAALDLLAADHAAERESGLACVRSESEPTGGGLTFAAVTLSLTLPLYLFIPKPVPMAIGQMVSSTARDYSDTQAFDDGVSGPSADRGDLNEQRPKARAADDPPRHAAGRREDSSPDLRQSQFDRGRGNQIVMFVKSSSAVYLRGSLYDRFEDGRWRRTAGAPIRRELDQRGFYPMDARPGGKRIVQTIEVVSDLNRADIYAAPGLQRLQFPGPVLYEFPDATFEAPQPLRSDTVYSVEARIGELQGRYLVGDAADAAPSAYLQLPEDLSSRIGALAAQVAGAEHSDLAKALALENYLRSHYEYSLDTFVTYQGDTPLDWFLFESKRGHCEFFASALAVMLRTQGIATRLARGFSLGERNPITGFYEVRVSDGHEWVEAFIPGRGWLMLEPTPFYPLPSLQPGQSVAEQTDSYLQRLAQTTHEIDPGSVRDLLIGAIGDAWSRLRHLQRQLMAQIGALGWWTVVIPLGLFAVSLAGLLGRRWYQDLRANARIRTLLRNLPSDQRAAVLRAAEALSSMSAARSLARGDGDTFRDYYRVLLSRYPDMPGTFADLFDDARYGNELVMTNPNALKSIAGIVATELERERFPRVRRELRKWREVVADAYARVRAPRLIGAGRG
jgi:transglutaminase-like putative cysteine protease